MPGTALITITHSHPLRLNHANGMIAAISISTNAQG
jgi:hypothetical protein